MNKLTLTIDEKPGEGFAVARLQGTVDVFSFKELKDTVNAWMEAKPKPRMLFDMTLVEYVGSSGWSVLFLLSALAINRQGRLVAFGINPKIQHSLDILSSKKRTLLIAKDFDEAVKMLDEEPPGDQV
jgi:anti-anti-sigma factor